MKKIIYSFIAAFVVISFSSCNNSNELNYSNYIVGDWACIGVDGNYFATDSIKFYSFDSNNTGALAFGQTDANGVGTCIKMQNVSYQRSGNIVTISATNSGGDVVRQQFHLYALTSLSMVADIESYTINGVEQNVGSQLLLQREYYPLVSPTISGIWQTPSLTEPSINIIREFFSNQTYNYYKYNTQTKTYIEQIINECSYLQYGQFMVMLYPNTSNVNQTYKCWDLMNQPTANKIQWFSKNASGNAVYETLTRISVLP